MARIIEDAPGRRMIMLSTDDIISVVREYQTITYKKTTYSDIRNALQTRSLYIPEEI